jgi:hypothetical protein
MRRVSQLGQAMMHGLNVITRFDCQFLVMIANFDRTTAFRRADPFDASARELPPAVHVEQPVLEAR